MRLTTLARKVQITPSKLVAFLEQKNIQIDNGINTRLNDETIGLVKNHFGFEETEVLKEPNMIEQEVVSIEEEVEDHVIVAEETGENEQEELSADTELPTPEEEDPKIVEQQETNVAAPKIGTVDDLEEGLAEDIELIKVKKVKLEGIKVIGKIDLPEKPKKEDLKENEEKGTEEEEKKSARRNKDQKHPNKATQKGKRSGLTISYEEKLKREERMKRRELKLKMNEEKDRKREHYIKTVQANSASSLARKKKKSKTQEGFSTQKTVVVHKNPIKRLWAWLNGQYDKH